MDMETRLRILKEVAIGREPATPDDEEMAAFRARMKAKAGDMAGKGQIMDIPSDW